LAIAAGYDVALSNSRGPQALKELVEELGPQARAATPAGAAAAGDLVVVSIPPRAYPAVPVEPLACRPVLDTINYIPQRDERIPGLGGSLSSSEVLQRHLGMAHVRCSATPPSGTSPRWPVRRAVTEFLEAIGYDTVDAVCSAPAAPFQFGTRTFVMPYGTFSDQRGTLPAQRQYSPHSTPDRDWRPKIR
jgi:8-hydroxy-5-deazaflavin:NADPH oxidoreductase